MRTDEEQTLETPRFILSHFRARAPEKDSPLKIVGLYADVPSHTLAMTVLRSVSRHCSAICKLRSEWWSFDMLQAASERDAAARIAADADMIWCSAPGCEALPEAVTSWTDSWSARRNETDCALVALLRCPAGYAIEQSPPRVYLCRFAQTAGLEFFAQRFDCDCDRPARTPSPFALLNGWFPLPSEPERGYRHWGINE